MIFTGVKKCKIWSRLLAQVALKRSDFENGAMYQKSETCTESLYDSPKYWLANFAHIP